jgi:hypothetical protein
MVADAVRHAVDLPKADESVPQKGDSSAQSAQSH